MDKTTYLQQAERQLSNCRFCEKLDSDPTLDFTQKITRVLNAMHARGHIDDKTMEYLTPGDSKPCRFYLLPKIHKENNRGDLLCQPMVTQLERYRNLLIFTFGRSLKTFHHTSKILYYQLLEENGKFNHSRKYHPVTMDAASLYTNIPHDDKLLHAEKYGNNEQFKNRRQNA